jgi:hypothetical protein
MCAECPLPLFISTAEDSIFPRDSGRVEKYPLFAISLKDCPGRGREQGTSIDFFPHSHPSTFNFAFAGLQKIKYRILYINLTLARYCF